MGGRARRLAWTGPARDRLLVGVAATPSLPSRAPLSSEPGSLVHVTRSPRPHPLARGARLARHGGIPSPARLRGRRGRPAGGRQCARRRHRGRQHHRRRLSAHQRRRRRQLLADLGRARSEAARALRRGRAAAAATIDWYAARGVTGALPARGGLAALTVPGAVDGWWQAHKLSAETLGSPLPWKALSPTPSPMRATDSPPPRGSGVRHRASPISSAPPRARRSSVGSGPSIIRMRSPAGRWCRRTSRARWRRSATGARRPCIAVSSAGAWRPLPRRRAARSRPRIWPPIARSGWNRSPSPMAMESRPAFPAHSGPVAPHPAGARGGLRPRSAGGARLLST